MAGVLSTLPREYGYVILVGTGSLALNGWLAWNVEKARKEFKIEHPTMYSDDNTEFNCIQRAHQHYLEMHAAFLSQLFISGTVFPRVASGLGVVYLVGRVAFSKGYYSKEPQNRRRGAFMAIGYFGLVGLTVATAVHQLRHGWGCPLRALGLRG